MWQARLTSCAIGGAPLVHPPGGSTSRPEQLSREQHELIPYTRLELSCPPLCQAHKIPEQRLSTSVEPACPPYVVLPAEYKPRRYRLRDSTRRGVHPLEDIVALQGLAFFPYTGESAVGVGSRRCFSVPPGS